MPRHIQPSGVGGVIRHLVAARENLASPRLTMGLLGVGMALVFIATLDQVNLGLWAVQQKYFRSFVVYVQAGPVAVPVLPGGYALGGLLLLNLACACAGRLASWKKAGLLLAHGGFMLLLAGEGMTGLWQEDSLMSLDEGRPLSHVESRREHELAIIDATDPAFDDIVAIPEVLLAAGDGVQHPRLPFRVVPRLWHPNSLLQPRPAGAPAPSGMAGIGREALVTPRPMAQRAREQNLPAAHVELLAADRSLGVYLVSAWIDRPQEFEHEGRLWKIVLRPKRTPLPFSLTLLEFRHVRHEGTRIPREFSSRLRLQAPGGGEDREVLIRMNQPLRHGGFTFYQAGYTDDDRAAILQVVRNPARSIPYVACAMMMLGLAAQFVIHLAGRSRAGVSSP